MRYATIIAMALTMALWASSVGAQIPCPSPTRAPVPLGSDFEILNWTWRNSQNSPRDGYVQIVGEARNNSALAGVPRVRAIARDVDGAVVGTTDLNGTDASGIAGGATGPISTAVTTLGEAVAVEVTIFGANAVR